MKTDLLFALRSLRRAPAFFCLAVATLGLGIAANTAIFSLFYQVLLRSLPVQQPEQLVVFHSDPPNLPGRASNDSNETVFSYALYLQMRDSRSLQGLVARSSAPVQMMIDGVAERGHAEIVSGNFFDVLGIRPRIGRLMGPSDDSVRGGNPVAVLSHEFWTRRFGGSSSVLNRTILLNGQPFTVVGVAPEGFRGVLAGNSPELFVPISMRAALNPDWDRYDRPNWQWVTMIGRLAPGVTRERALAELQPRFTTVMRAHIEQLNIRNQTSRQRLLAKRIELRPAAGGLNSLEQAWRQPLFVLLAMVLLLLVIGCTNLVNLLMGRALNRAREISIRLALGAGRARVLRLLLTESALLGLVGTLCGLLLTPVLTHGIIRLLPTGELGGWLAGEINLPILGFSMILMLIATLLFGLLPALQATRKQVSPLGERTQTSGGHVHSRSRKILVAGQIALSLVLLCTAGLFGRSLANLMQHKPGFRADHLLSFTIDAGLGGYKGDRGLDLYRELSRRLAAQPGVESVSLADAGPLSHSESMSNVSAEGYTPKNDDEMDCDSNDIGPGFFHTIGTALLEGREFDQRDAPGAPKVAIVNRAFVKRFFGNRGAVGRKMEIGAGGPLDIEIVGVAADLNNLSIRKASKPTFYIPFEQATQPKPPIHRATFFVRSNIAFDALSGSIRAAMAKLDATLPVFALQPMQVNIDESIYTDRLIAALSTAFGLLALLLTAVGLYGVIAYLVSRRTAEIGIRMVLGASPRAVLSMILGEVALLLAIGGAAGVLGAIAAGRAIASQLFAMPGIDPLVLMAAVVVLSSVALGAACVPAIRAARIQPLEALRHD
jgi:predicted permease